MKIDCYLSLSCGAENDLRENIFKALGLEEMEAEVNFHRTDEKEAHRLGLRGSPSVRIDGKDIQPLDTSGFA
jgi:hypothetical protein